MPRRRSRLLPACALALVALAGCGDRGAAGTTPAAKPARAPSYASAALRANAADANTLAGQGAGALKARLAKLAGHPVVVNQWASWCGPCRQEFPFFAAAVAEHGHRVAFLGINFRDARDAADAFMRASPPGFASIYDPDGKAARSLGGGVVAPTTFFVGSDGQRRYTKLGGYADAAALEADIGRWAR